MMAEKSPALVKAEERYNAARENLAAELEKESARMATAAAAVRKAGETTAAARPETTAAAAATGQGGARPKSARRPGAKGKGKGKGRAKGKAGGKGAEVLAGAGAAK